MVGEVTATRTFASRHRLTAGTEYREHLRQMQSIDAGDGMFEDSHRSRQLGLYLQDELRITDKITAVLGARADYWSLDGWSAHPRGGLIVRPDADTSLKLLYGSAYRAANAYERFYTQGAAVANPLLQPERLRTGEFVAERYVGGRLRLTAAAYVTHISRLISQYGDIEEMTWYDNGAAVDAVGTEFEAERRWTSGILARGSFTAQSAREGDSDQRLSNSPARLGTFRIEAPHRHEAGHVRGGLAVRLGAPDRPRRHCRCVRAHEPDVALRSTAVAWRLDRCVDLQRLRHGVRAPGGRGVPSGHDRAGRPDVRAPRDARLLKEQGSRDKGAGATKDTRQESSLFPCPCSLFRIAPRCRPSRRGGRPELTKRGSSSYASPSSDASPSMPNVA